MNNILNLNHQFCCSADGMGTRERWSPITPGEWSVGAFAVHPTLGLGLAAPQKLTTALPLSMTAELPESLQKGETIAIVITIKSSLTVDTNVEVTFHNSDQYYEFEPLENNVDSSKSKYYDWIFNAKILILWIIIIFYFFVSYNV